MHEIVVRHIRQFLADAEMQDQELAAALGRPKSAVSNWLNGKARISLRDLQRIADALGKDVVELIAGKDAHLKGAPREPEPERVVEIVAKKLGVDVVIKNRKT